MIAQPVATYHREPQYHAHLWRRTAAYLLDILVLFVLLVPVVIVLDLVQAPVEIQNGLGYGAWATYFLAYWNKGATPGMRAMDLRLVDSTFATPPPRAVALRLAAWVAVQFLLLIPIFAIVFIVARVRKRPMWHDVVSKTYVLRTSEVAALTSGTDPLVLTSTSSGLPTAVRRLGLVVVGLVSLVVFALYALGSVWGSRSAELDATMVAAIGRSGTVLVQQGQSSGSGVYLGDDLILTAFHVVEAGETATITFEGEQVGVASLISSDPDTDLALLTVSGLEEAGARAIPWGDSERLRPGDPLLVVGYPVAGLTVSRGIVSALLDVDGVYLVQTDAAVNPGNSGGPVLDATGTLVGIADFILRDTEGLNFAIASRTARDFSERPLAVATAAPTATPLTLPAEPAAAYLVPTQGYDYVRPPGDNEARTLSFMDASKWDGLWQQIATSAAVRFVTFNGDPTDVVVMVIALDPGYAAASTTQDTILAGLTSSATFVTTTETIADRTATFFKPASSGDVARLAWFHRTNFVYLLGDEDAMRRFGSALIAAHTALAAPSVTPPPAGGQAVTPSVTGPIEVLPVDPAAPIIDAFVHSAPPNSPMICVLEVEGRSGEIPPTDVTTDSRGTGGCGLDYTRSPDGIWGRHVTITFKLPDGSIFATATVLVPKP